MQIEINPVFKREMLISSTVSGIEKEDFDSKFDEIPKPFTPKERDEWLSQLKRVAVSSDAFVSHDHDELLRSH